MLGRKTYTPEEIAHARSTIAAQLATYDALRAAAGSGATTDAAWAAFDPCFFDNLVLVLDRLFVHRVRPVVGKDGNPLNEVELLSESLIRDGVFTANKVIKLVPEDSVTKAPFGEPIRLTRDQFEQLSDAFFAELETRFLET